MGKQSERSMWAYAASIHSLGLALSLPVQLMSRKIDEAGDA